MEDGRDRLGSWPKRHLTVVSKQAPLLTLDSILYNKWQALPRLGDKCPRNIC